MKLFNRAPAKIESWENVPYGLMAIFLFTWIFSSAQVALAITVGILVLLAADTGCRYLGNKLGI